MGQRIDQAQRALHRGFRLQRMQIGEARQAGHLFVQPRIVLHRARSQRIKSRINRIVLLTQPCVVPHHLRLGQTRKTNGVRPVEPAKTALHRRRFGQVDTAPTRRILFKDQRLFQTKAAVPRVSIG